MNEESSSLFEVIAHEEEFVNLCEKLKVHPFESPWTIKYTKTEDFLQEISEINIPEHILTDDTQIKNTAEEISSQIASNERKDNYEEINKLCPLTLSKLHDSLMSIQKSSESEDIKGIEILDTICPSQVLELQTALRDSLLNDLALTAFLKAILNLNKSLSLSVACALVRHIIYPQVFENKQSTRNVLTAVLSFCEVYPKSIIDEVLTPCLKKEYLETLHMETLIKMVKSIVPDQYVSHMIKNVAEESIATENSFTILQILIERKVFLECSLHKTLAWTLESWAKINTKNVKFIKLLISILTVYGSELNDEQIAVYSDVIKSNQTIMKRAAENVLKKLKT